MSIWYEIKDKEDVVLSDDGQSIQVNFDSNEFGNIWVEIPICIIQDIINDKK